MKPLYRIHRDPVNGDWVEVRLRGHALHNSALLNKSTAFTEEEREELGLRGLLPPGVTTLEDQRNRAFGNYGRRGSDIERYMDLMALMDRNETLFYRVLVDHIDELMPIIYTPTVGEACKSFGHIFRKGRGIYITPDEVDHIPQVLDNWPIDDVKVIVVTDGERILGLGDQGSGGMGIGIGKLSLYVAAAGIHPGQTLPICLDVGTNNEELLKDPLYLGVRRERVRGDEYLRIVDNFMEAVTERFPGVLVQFEDFATKNAIPLLARYRDRYLCFNDDIQGTAAVAAAGVIAASKRAGRKITDETFVMAGAGGAAIGIVDLLIAAMVNRGITEEEARSRFYFVDSRGLVYEGRGELVSHKARFARKAEEAESVRDRGGDTELLGVVKAVRPTVLVGASGQPGIFDQSVIEALSATAEHPVVFMLSNPTSRAECTPDQAIRWSRGKARIATGSPFDPVEYDGETRRIGQANNVFIFPGLGVGVLAARAERITDGLFLAAMNCLGDEAPKDALYPAIPEIRGVSRHVAFAVAKAAVQEGVAPPATDDELNERIDSLIWEPEYLPYRPWKS